MLIVTASLLVLAAAFASVVMVARRLATGQPLAHAGAVLAIALATVLVAPLGDHG
jgi:hypothetical protein